MRIIDFLINHPYTYIKMSNASSSSSATGFSSFPSLSVDFNSDGWGPSYENLPEKVSYQGDSQKRKIKYFCFYMVVKLL